MPTRRRVEHEHPRLSARVLAHVRRHGETHPRDVAQAFGRVRTASDWGGDSTATTRILEVLHHRGELRVAWRVNGIKVYDVARPPAPPLSSSVRAQALLRLLLELYASLPEASFRQLARMVTASSLSPALCAKTLERLREGPDVRRLDVAGAPWLLPAGEALAADGDDRVRLLAPFDPVVWDRRRFAAFWGWDYRLPAGVTARRVA